MYFNNIKDLKKFLDEKLENLNSHEFITNDPICVPHSFSKKEDIELSAFLTSSLAWGNRKIIINKSLHLMKLMDNQPYDFIINASNKEIKSLKKFVHRTFNGNTTIDFIFSLKNILNNFHNLENVFTTLYEKYNDLKVVLIEFRYLFTKTFKDKNSFRHISSPENNSASKRLNLFLKWMIRKDEKNIDFGLWKTIPMSKLYIPLDIHTGNTARKLGILKRKQNDWKAVEELTSFLKKLDENDPIKYDFALFLMDF